MLIRLPCFRSLLPLWGLVLAASNAAAGGHFDVDDADTLEEGRCQYELWAGRAESSTAFQHAGMACRVGMVELGVNGDRGSRPDVRTAGPAVKWTWLGDSKQQLRAALEFSAGWDLRHHGKPSRQWLLPVTWQPLPTLMLHANLGADWAGGSARTARRGLAAEWALDEKLSLVVERNRAVGAWTTRGGFRVGLTPALTLDLSAARVRPGSAVYTVGFTQEFGR